MKNGSPETNLFQVLKKNDKVVYKLNLLKETVTILSQLIRDQYILLCMLRSNL